MTEKLSHWDIETNVVKREVENENEIPNEQKMNLNFFCLKTTTLYTPWRDSISRPIAPI
jgi:hypothetical protein